MTVDWARARRWWIAGGILAAIGLFLIVLSVAGHTMDMAIVGIVLLIAGSAIAARPLGFEE